MTGVTKPKRTSFDGGKAYYGDTFIGYQRLDELKEFLEAFKEFYYQEKIKNPKRPVMQIIQQFNNDFCTPDGKRFHPYQNQISIWVKKWDWNIRESMTKDTNALVERKQINQILKTRDDDDNFLLGIQENELERGVKTLGGELLNDAFQMLRDDQENEDFQTGENLIRRRNYVVNVFAHITKLVHGKASLMLKASEEKRNNASFLMDLLAQATSGKLTDEQLAVLETNKIKKVEIPIETPNVQTVI